MGDCIARLPRRSVGDSLIRPETGVRVPNPAHSPEGLHGLVDADLLLRDGYVFSQLGPGGLVHQVCRCKFLPDRFNVFALQPIEYQCCEDNCCQPKKDTCRECDELHLDPLSRAEHCNDLVKGSQ
jgi:hypothetical protein